MIIEQVDLINFKKYAQEKIVLGKKVLGIFGPNGAGKSTIFDAVCWCLYGVTPTIGKEGQSVKQDELIRDGQEDMGVEVTFRYDGQVYKVHRFLRREGVSATVRLENELVARSSKEVTSYITRTLGLDAKAFISASFIRQNEIDLLTSQRSSKRKEIINRLFNLQLYDQFLFDAKDQKRDRDTEAMRREEEIKSIGREVENYGETLCDEAALKKEISSYSKKLIALQKDLDGHSAERLSLLSKLEELREHENAYRELLARKIEINRALEKARKTLDGANRAQDELQHTKGELGDLIAAKEEHDRLGPVRERHIGLSYRVSSLLSRREELEGELRKRAEEISGTILSLAKRKDVTSAQLKEAMEELEAVRNNSLDPTVIGSELAKVSGELEKIRSRTSKEEQELAKMASLKDKLGRERGVLSSLSGESRCPTCKQTIDEATRVGVIEANELEIEKLSVSMSRQKGKIKRLRELEGESESRRLKLEREQRDATASRLDIAQKSVRLEHLGDGIAETEERIRASELELDSTKKRLRGALADIDDDVAACRTEMGSLSYDEGLYNSLKASMLAYEEAIKRRERLEGMAKTRDGASLEVASLEKSLSELAGEQRGHAEKSAGIPAVRESIGNVEKIISGITQEMSSIRVEEGRALEKMRSNEALKSRRDGAMSKLSESKEELERLRSEIHEYNVLLEAFRNIPINIHERLKPIIQVEVSKLLDSITQGKYPAVMIDEDYTVQISYNGAFYPIYRFSGGEKDLINLCLRIGISRVLVSLSKEQGFAHLESLFLDETFSSLDSDRRRNLMAVLNRLENFFSQIIIITHVEDIKEMMPDAILVEEAEDGTALVSRLA